MTNGTPEPKESGNRAVWFLLSTASAIIIGGGTIAINNINTSLQQTRSALDISNQRISTLEQQQMELRASVMALEQEAEVLDFRVTKLENGRAP